MKLRLLFSALIVSLLLAWVLPASAQMVHDNFLDPVISQYADNASSWEGPLRAYAMRIFWMLALVDVVWVIGQLIFTKSDFNAWLGELAKQLLFIGFFYTLLTHSSEWAGAILQSFRLAGNAANSAVGATNGLEPSNIFDTGVNIAGIFIKSLKFDILHLMDNLAIIISGFLIMISFALIAALEIVVLVESYIYTYAGILFLGFGGSHFTKDFAVRFLIGLVAVGAKLFVIQLVVGLAQTMARQWEAQVEADQALINMELLLKMVGGSIVFLTLAKMIPELVQGMVNGASYSNNRNLLSSGIAAGHLGLAAGAGILAAGLGTTSLVTGALGASDASSAMRNTANYMSNLAGIGTASALSHAADEHRAGFSQYMPNGHKTKSKDEPEISPSWRPGGDGEELPQKTNMTSVGNSISA